MLEGFADDVTPDFAVAIDVVVIDVVVAFDVVAVNEDGIFHPL